jgi:hypothetical protein
MPAKDSHVNRRGNTKDRRARRLHLLSAEAGFGGNGVEVPCWECGQLVDYVTLVVDRIVPGSRRTKEYPNGGTYERRNIRPQCHACAAAQGYALGWGAHRGGSHHHGLNRKAS